MKPASASGGGDASDEESDEESDKGDELDQLKMPSGATAAMAAAKRAGRPLVEEVTGSSSSTSEERAEQPQRVQPRSEIALTAAQAISHQAQAPVIADESCDLTPVSSRRVTRDRAARPNPKRQKPL
jgi:hypothetical protein|uniref:Uncharacterized protein n=1 Tax=Haptolina ericina TaxID=156174 RepID=A0A7S3ER31_9EUKA|mmetsp:Transcript_15394/g.34412  ORF Transcript_15394/g.34412 Transcript_15394/m.34412 type:complete len:127 (+) Transcript_15394:279-659(+)